VVRGPDRVPPAMMARSEVHAQRDVDRTSRAGN
jgi:hypothetical protein